MGVEERSSWFIPYIIIATDWLLENDFRKL